MKDGVSFRTIWRLRGPLGDLLVVPRREVRYDMFFSAPPVLFAQLDVWLRDPASRQAVLGMYRAAGGSLNLPPNRLSSEDINRSIKPTLVAAFRSGELMVIPAPALRASGDSVGGEATQAELDARTAGAPARPAKQTTWIEILLVDDQGHPVPNEPYWLELPDGQVRKGRLDASGKARADGIDQGTCEVWFPNIDAREHESA